MNATELANLIQVDADFIKEAQARYKKTVERMNTHKCDGYCAICAECEADLMSTQDEINFAFNRINREFEENLISPFARTNQQTREKALSLVGL